MEVDVTRAAINLEPKYRVTTLTREERTRGTGTPSVVKGLIWFRDGSRMKEGTGTGAGVHGKCGEKVQYFLGRYATVFQAIFACANEI